MPYKNQPSSFQPKASVESEQTPERVLLVSPLNWLGLAAIALLLAAFVLWLFFGTVEQVVDGPGIIIRDSQFGIFAVAATHGGKVTQVLVREGELVKAGQTIATLQAGPNAPPNETEIRSEHAGRVIEVIVGAGTMIPPGRTILRLESLAGDYEALAYVSPIEGKKIKAGMAARVVPSTRGAHIGGHILGQVSYVSQYPVTRDYLASELGGNRLLAENLLANGSAIEVAIVLPKDPALGSNISVESGLLVDSFVILQKSRPISLLFPHWK